MNPECTPTYFRALSNLGVDPASIAKAETAVRVFFEKPPEKLDQEPATYFAEIVEACQAGAHRASSLPKNGK